MNLIFFTGLLQVTVATDESTPKSATSDGNKHLDNGKLASLGGMNMAHFAKLGSGDKNCVPPEKIVACVKKAKEIANITDESNNATVIYSKFASIIKNENTSVSEAKIVCNGLDELMTCGAKETCQDCDYTTAILNDIIRLGILGSFLTEGECDYEIPEAVCNSKQWKTIHKKPYPGECVPDADKLKCVKKAAPKATDWDEGFFLTIIQLSLAPSKETCSSVLDMAKCELTSGCHKCKDNEETELKGLLKSALFDIVPCKNISGINEDALKIDCNKVPTPKPTVTPTPTSSSKTVIIIVVVVVIVLLIIGGIVVYCCFFAGDKGKKKTGGKQGQKVTGKGGAASGSKMGSDGKSSSVRGGSKSKVGSKLAADSKVGAGKSVT